MATREVSASSANAAQGSALEELAAIVNQLATLANELKTDLNGVTNKLDADAGVSDTDYNSLHGVAASDADDITFRETGTPD